MASNMPVADTIEGSDYICCAAPSTFAVLPLECTSFEASLNSTAAARRSGRQCGAQLFPVYSWDQSAGVCQLNSLSTHPIGFDPST
jgi:hypothetical protein